MILLFGILYNVFRLELNCSFLCSGEDESAQLSKIGMCMMGARRDFLGRGKGFLYSLVMPQMHMLFFLFQL